MGISVRCIPKSGISGSKASLKVNCLLFEKEHIHEHQGEEDTGCSNRMQ